MPIPPTAAPSISMQKIVADCSAIFFCKNSWASSIVYGCGKRSRRPSQTFRLLACFASESPSSSRHGRMVQLLRTRCIDYLVELNAGLLDLAVRQEPDKRFVMKIDNLDAIAPEVVKITTERRYQLDLVLASEFLTNFLNLRFVANHQSEMTHVCRLRFFYFENREELVLTQFEKSISLTAAHLFEIENVLVKRHCLLNIIYFDRDMIASIDLHAHVPT